MEKILNITNGDGALQVMRQIPLPGDYLPWRDILHQGPVPADLSLSALSEVRAEYIASRNWGELAALREDFRQRDHRLASFADYDKVILWFEHDLYDQLQLIQILDWFATQDLASIELSLLCIGEGYLGALSVEEMRPLLGQDQTVTPAQLNLARQAWAAFRDPRPQLWQALLDQDTSALTYLHDAVLRMLEEYPSEFNGLSRTAHQALCIIRYGPITAAKAFGQYQATEKRRFLGDSSFWEILREMLDASPPLLSMPPGVNLSLPASPAQQLSLTEHGQKVLQGKLDWLEVRPIDKWIGGVQLSPAHYWRWDGEQTCLCEY